jgi:peptidoglycan/LPS O-acetylase OafA/YrhL
MQILWSISIEEQFYLFWPWGMRYLRRRGLQLCAILLIVVANLTLFYLGHLHAEIAVAIGGNSFVQFEMFATGILLALANRLGKWHSAKMGALLALSGPILWFVACFEFHVTEGIPVKVAYLMIGYGLVALGCAAVLQGFCMMGSSNMPQWVANLGKISYGLYVFHMLGILFANAAINPSGGFFHFAASVLLALVLTIATAVISYAYFETPFLRLKRHFEIMHTRPI